MLKKECLVVGAVVFLFFGLAVMPSINAVDYRLSKILQYDGNLSGYVFDTEFNPIAGALIRVYFHETYEEDFSDENGYYHVDDIPICYCLKNCTCSKAGYSTEWVLMGITENTTHDFILTQLGPVADLNCWGEIDLSDVEPGGTITGTVTIENVGDSGSLLNWEIIHWPTFGIWTFDPFSGFNLLSGETTTVDVNIVVPDPPEEEQWDQVIFVNTDDLYDLCIIDVYYPGESVPVINQIFMLLENHFPIIYRILTKLFIKI